MTFLVTSAKVKLAGAKQQLKCEKEIVCLAFLALKNDVFWAF